MVAGCFNFENDKKINVPEIKRENNNEEVRGCCYDSKVEESLTPLEKCWGRRIFDDKCKHCSR